MDLNKNNLEALEKLGSLYKSGALSKEEFETLKKELLGKPIKNQGEMKQEEFQMNKIESSSKDNIIEVNTIVKSNDSYDNKIDAESNYVQRNSNPDLKIHEEEESGKSKLSNLPSENDNSNKNLTIALGCILLLVTGLVFWFVKSNQNTLAQNKAIMEKAITDSIALTENLMTQNETIENEEDLLLQLRRDSLYISENEKAQANQDSLDSMSKENYLESEPNSYEAVEQIPIARDEMPTFYGGEEGLTKYLGSSIRYPQFERDAGISGTVIVSFEINELGDVQNARVERGVKGGPGLDKEALRVINNMPKWKAGKKNGSPAVIQMTYPIKFRLI
jgi:protein TonB